MKNILNIKTNKTFQTYQGTLIKNHLVYSGDLCVDWIDTQLYINEHNLTDVEIDGSVWYFLVLNNNWESYTIGDLHFVVPKQLNKENLTVVDIQDYYKQIKKEQENNPFKNFV
jgi:hypothetical protein